MKTERFFKLKIGLTIDLDDVSTILETPKIFKKATIGIKHRFKESPTIIEIDNYYLLDHPNSNAITESFNEDKENLIAAWKAYKLEAAKQLNVNLRDDMAQSALTGLVANPNSFDPTEKDTESVV